VVAVCAGRSAEAAPSRIQFKVGPQAYSEALLDIAQQANVTLIGAAACQGQFRGRLDGALTLEQALSQVLAAAPCGWKLIAPGAIEIRPGASAETIRSAPPATISELLVTATKRVRNPRELAVAVTAIPRAELHSAGAADAAEVAGQLAGVLATNLGPGRNKLLLRGLSDGAYTGRARSIVATYLDDIPINYNAPDPDLRLVDIERVEVARGPQGALYGAGSISGVYRLVSRKPDLNDWSTEVRATGADTKNGARSYAVEGYANLPILGDMLGARVAAYHEIQGGYLDDIGQMRDDVDRTERRGARLILLFQPDDAWMVSATVAGQHLRSDDTHYTTPGLGLKRNVRIPEPHVNDIALATGTIRRSWGGAELTSATGYIRHAYGSIYDGTATQRNYTAFDRFAQTSAYSERTKTEMLVQDIFLTSRGAGRLEWLAGLYGSDTRTRTPTEFLVQVPRADLALVYGDQRRDHIRELAAYGEASYRISPAWTVAVGGRVFHVDTRTRSDVVSESFPARGFDRNVSFTGFSPKVSLQYEFASGDLAYAVISEGYRAGGINSGGAVPLPPQRETYRPDRLLNYELGLKAERFEHRLGVNAALFYAHWKDIQTDQFRPSGIPYTTNAGDAHILGVETEVAWRTDWGLTTQLNGRYSHVETTKGNVDLTPNLANGLPGAPPFSAGGLISHERPFGDWSLRLVGQATYIGRSRVTFDASQPSMGNYTRTKLSAELSRRNVGVQLYVINPLDARGDTFAFGNPFNPGQTRQITPQRPRTVGVTISAAL